MSVQTRILSKALSWPLVAALAIAVASCSTPNVTHLSTAQVNELVDRAKTGNVVLQCQVACAGSWGASRATASEYHERGDWRSLALLVASIGYEDDLSWYYLGRATEGLGAPAAAAEYYRRALATPSSCDALFDNCDGIRPRVAAADGLRRLAASETATGVPDATTANGDRATTVTAQPSPNLPKLDAAPTVPVPDTSNTTGGDAQHRQLRELIRARQSAATLISDSAPSSPEVATLVDAKPGSIGFPVAPMPARRIGQEERVMVREAVVKGFFDPYSAQVTIEMDRDRHAICGRANAKNRFGAYVGDRLFLAEVERDPQGRISRTLKVRMEEPIQGDAMAIVYNTDLMIACLLRGFQVGANADIVAPEGARNGLGQAVASRAIGRGSARLQPDLAGEAARLRRDLGRAVVREVGNPASNRLAQGASSPNRSESRPPRPSSRGRGRR